MLGHFSRSFFDDFVGVRIGSMMGELLAGWRDSEIAGQMDKSCED